MGQLTYASISSSTFTPTILSVTNIPTLDDIPNPDPISEDSDIQSIGLSGISDGDISLDQSLTITAISDNTDLIGTVNVNYTTGSTATLSYKPKSDGYGFATITVKVADEDGFIEKTFNVTVTPVNDAPTIDPIGPVDPIDEDAPQQTINLSGITPGFNEPGQTVTVTATSSLTDVIPNPVASFNSGVWSISYTPLPNQSGEVSITVTVADDDSNQRTASEQFTQIVNSVNDPPTINTIDDISINEDSGSQTVIFNGITDDGENPKNITVTATSDQTAIVADPEVIYTSPNTTGSLTITPQSNAFGSANITVRVTDKNAEYTETTFTIDIENINDPPTLNDIPSPINILEDASSQTINLVGISPGIGETEPLQISVTSSNTALINEPTGSISENIGTITYSPVANANGTATLTVRIDDGQTTNNIVEKDVAINVVSVNDAPMFTIGDNQAISENAGQQIIEAFASGMDDGDPEDQILTFQISTSPISGNLTFITAPTIDLVTGDLTYEASPNSNGSVIVTVKLSDNGGTDNNGVNETSKSFEILVTAINAPPTFLLNGNPPATNEDFGNVVVSAFAYDMDDGDIDLDQELTFELSQTSGDLTFVDFPMIDANSGNLTYTSAPNSHGTALIKTILKETVSSKPSDESNFTIMVNAVNDPPTSGDATVQTNEDVAYNFKQGDFTFADEDGHGFEGLSISKSPTKGELTYDGNQVSLGTAYTDVSLLVYIAENNGAGTGYANFDFFIRDESGDFSTESYTMTIDVVAQADDPTSASNSISTLEDQDYTFKTGDFPYSDSDGDSFNGIIIQSNVAKGSLLENSVAISSFPATIADVTKLVFRPVNGESGSPYTSFTFDVIDATGANSERFGPYTMSINIGAGNDPPTGNDGSVTLEEDQLYSFQASDFPFNDPDGHGFAGVLITQIESIGTLKYDGADVNNLDYCPDVTKLTYQPPLNQNGPGLANFKFKVRDTSSELNQSTDEYTMTFNVTPVNDVPVFSITGNPPTINEDAGQQILPAFVSSFNDGDPEVTQSLTFDLSYSLPSGLSFTNVPTIDPSTGSLTYTTAPNAFGTVEITVVLSDDGGGTNTATAQKFQLTVTGVNDPPTLTDIDGPINVDEDSDEFLVNLTGIGYGPANENQTVSVTASSSNEELIMVKSMNYTSPEATGSISLQPVSNATGSASITVTVSDGGTNNNTIVKSFQVVIKGLNDIPTLNAIATPAPIQEDAGTQTINLSGISAGNNETQTLEVTAVSSNTDLIPTPNVYYTSPDAIGRIEYTPVANKFGTSEITVTVNDGAEINNIIERKFIVEVLEINDPPTLDELPTTPIQINEDAVMQTLQLTGISAGSGETQTLIISAVSNETDIIPNPTIGEISNGQAILSYQPVANKNGLVTISVTIDDGQASNSTIQKSFQVNVRPVNDPPTLDPIANSPFTIDENANPQNITLTGISAGAGEMQALNIYTSSSNVAVMENPGINYVQGGATATLTFVPKPNTSGSTIITVFVDDLGATNNLVSRDFVVNINEINDPPTINDIIPPGNILEDAGQQSISLSGITAGVGESNQTVTLTAVTTDTDVISNVTVNYSGNNNGTILFTPVADANGSASILLTLDDGQPTNNKITKTIPINILPVNDPPTIDVISSPVIISEGAEQQTIELTGIGVGPKENGQTLTISAISDQPSIIPNPTVSPVVNGKSNLKFTPIPNTSGTVKITVTANDGQSNNNLTSQTFTIIINSVNNIPSFNLSNDITITENSGLQQINNFATDINDGDPEVTQGLNFILSISGNLNFKTNPSLNATNGQLSFEVAANNSGESTISVQLIDDGSPQASSTLKSFKIKVLPINGNPSFELNGSETTSTEDDGPIVVGEFAKNMDDGDPELDQNLTFKLTTISGNLSFASFPQINAINGNLSYQAAPNANGSSVISVVLEDNEGGESKSLFFTINVSSVNDPPIGKNDNVNTLEDVPYRFSTNDFTYSDVESNLFGGIQIVGLENTGDLEYNGADVVLNQLCPNVSQLVFKPDQNSNSSARFQFKLRDGQGALSETYDMDISVTPVEDNPTSAHSEVSTLENTTYTFKKNDFTFNDPDGDSFETVRIFSVETAGDLKYEDKKVKKGTEITNFNELKFVPKSNENGSPYSSFEFEVKDGKGNYSTHYTMSINVGSTNDRPVGANESITMLEDGIYTFKVNDFTFNDSDGHIFNGIQIESLETKGDLEYNGSDIQTLPTSCPDVTKLVFKPEQNADGSNYASFTFRIKDNSSSLNLSSAIYSMTINVSPINDPPVFTISTNPPIVNEDAGTQTIPGFISSINDGDENQNQTLTFSTPELNGSSGNLSFSDAPKVSNQGDLTYRAAPNTYGTASFSIFLKDNGGGNDQSETKLFTITVKSINDRPTISPIADRPAIQEDAGIQTINLNNITAGPLENQPIIITVVSSNPTLIPTPTVTYQSPNTTGSISYQPSANLSGTSVITVKVSDGDATNGETEESFLVTVNAVNDPPTINDITNPAPIVENSGKQTIQLGGISGGQGEDQTVLITATSNNPSLIPNPSVSYLGGSTGQLSYTPIVSASGSAIITVKVDDQNGKATNKSFTVVVSNVNDQPTLDPIAKPATIIEDALLQKIVLTGISAGANENQQLSITATSSNLSLISNVDIAYSNNATTATMSYKPIPNQFGSSIITVTVNDGGATNNLISRQVTIAVAPVPDVPQVSNTSTNQGVQSNTGLVIDRNDNDGAEVAYFKITNIRNGTLYLRNGITKVLNNEFITYAHGKAGLRFSPNSTANGSFDVQASLTDANSGLGSDIATATIFINSIPTTTNLPNLTLNEDSPKITFDLYQTFDDKEDVDSKLIFEVTNTAPNIVSAEISGKSLTITFLENKSGTAYITVKCIDTKGAFVEDEIVLNVTPINDKPIFTSTPIVSGQQGSKYQYNIVTTDIENDSRSFTIVAPSWLILTDKNNGTATLSGTPKESDNGSHDIEIIVKENNSNLSESQKFTLHVNNVNDPPVFTSVPPLEAFETEKYTYQIIIDDPDANDSYEVHIDPGTAVDWLILSAQAPYTLQGFPPVGAEGNYKIKLIVIDDGGLTAEQTFSIAVSSQNIRPQISNFDLPNLVEDVSHAFKLEDFTSVFTDEDPGDMLVFITIDELPKNGKMTKKGIEIHENDTILRDEISSMEFIPNENFYGFTYFVWNASDGKSMAQTSRVDMTIAAIEDAPKIINMETDPKVYAFGETSVFVTDNAEVLEVDDGRIGFAEIKISSNYQYLQDSLAIDQFDGISTHWNDTTGVLFVIGIKSNLVYQDIIRSLVYINQKRFAPDTKKRTIEIVISDGELLSTPVTRNITFLDTFIELDIPTGITPNDDGANDVWNIENIDIHEDAIVQIMTREGTILYKSVGYYIPWDGTYNGKYVDAGVYYYTINIQKYERKFAGSITVLR